MLVRKTSVTWSLHDFPKIVTTGVPTWIKALMLASSSGARPGLRVLCPGCLEIRCPADLLAPGGYFLLGI